MKNKILVYPAVFRKEENNKYSIFVPDLDNAATFGDNLTDAIYMTKDLIGSYAVFAEQDKKNLPEASEIQNISLENEKDFVTLIEVDYDAYKKSLNKAVKKTVYIPKDINDEAEIYEINFSKVLRDALKKEIIKVKNQA